MAMIGRLGMFLVGDRVADVDLLDTDQCADVPAGHGLHLGSQGRPPSRG